MLKKCLTGWCRLSGGVEGCEAGSRQSHWLVLVKMRVVGVCVAGLGQNCAWSVLIYIPFALACVGWVGVPCLLKWLELVCGPSGTFQS